MDELTVVLLVIAVGLLLLLLWKGRRSAAGDAVFRELETTKAQVERLEKVLREEGTKTRLESGASAQQARGEIAQILSSMADSSRGQMKDIADMQKGQMDSFAGQLTGLTQLNEQKLERLREAVEAKLQHIQRENSEKLEQMRATVDERLHATLEERLGKSFQMVSQRLEQVHRGLGEMQSLASGVGDLKKMLTNVKARGTWGEVQLGALLDQILTKEQFERNVITRQGSNERVEFAIKLPGRDGESGKPVWLPLDAKFPLEDYHRLTDAHDRANAEVMESARKMLFTRIKACARAISEKYLDPPRTTDFAVMFLPIEGLYAEVLREATLVDTLHREYRITIAGPTTLSALLNSLQMGFRTLAIEKRSSEVWTLLGSVKAEFGRFGEILERTQKKLQEASSTIENAATRSRVIERKLKDVQELPQHPATRTLGSGRTEEDRNEELF